jgi:hypothetical protein
MITKLLGTSALLVSIALSAAPTANNDIALLEAAAVTTAGELVKVRVLRNYDDLVTLGDDPTTRQALYPHRSVALGYLANCEAGKVALDSWQMFSGNSGQGPTVWADRAEALEFLPASSAEELAALRGACSLRAAAVAGASNIP